MQIFFAAPICGTYAECQTVTGDNGAVSCQSYCMGQSGAPWNGELPAEWNGAICAYTGDPNLSCNDVSPVDVTCTCIRSGYGWNIESWPIGPPLNQGLLSIGNAAAHILWAPSPFVFGNGFNQIYCNKNGGWSPDTPITCPSGESAGRCGLPSPSFL